MIYRPERYSLIVLDEIGDLLELAATLVGYGVRLELVLEYLRTVEDNVVPATQIALKSLIV